jgi:hypothetical protein
VNARHPLSHFVVIQKLTGFPGEPFAASGVKRARQAGGSTEQQLMSAFGFPKAPSDVDVTPAEQVALDALSRHKMKLTPAEVDKSRHRRQLASDLRDGKPGAQQAIEAARTTGEFTPRQARDIERTSQETYLQRLVKPLSLAPALQVVDRLRLRHARST